MNFIKKIILKNFHPIDYGGFFSSLAESKGDIFIASTFESELVTNELYSKFIEIQLSEIIKRRVQSQDNLNLFDEYVLTDCHSIGEAFVNGIISKKDLLSLFLKRINLENGCQMFQTIKI